MDDTKPDDYYRMLELSRKMFSRDDIMRHRGIKPLNLDELQAKRDSRCAKRKALALRLMRYVLAIEISCLILYEVYRKMENNIPYRDTFNRIACWGCGYKISDFNTAEEWNTFAMNEWRLADKILITMETIHFIKRDKEGRYVYKKIYKKRTD